MIAVNEKEMLDKLAKAKRVLLYEPKSHLQFIPMGLAKIATYVKRNGGEVYFSRDPRDRPGVFDLICVTTLFSFDYSIYKAYINNPIINTQTEILVGGICSTLLASKFIEEIFSDNVFLYKGVSKVLDFCVPDYSINWQLKSKYADEEWEPDYFSFTFTQRGCPNRCPYCVVWRLEKENYIIDNWKEHIVASKKGAVICDNNLSSSENHFENVVKHLKDNDKHVVFDSGFDCKHITKEKADILSGIKIAKYGLRLAFDRIEEDGVVQQAIETLITAGLSKYKMLIYILYNYMDTPQQSVYRLNEIIKYGIRPYPQRYIPPMSISNKKGSRYIGKYWTEKLADVFWYFAAMRGFGKKVTFEEYITIPILDIKIESGLIKFNLGEDDFACWDVGVKLQRKITRVYKADGSLL